VMRSAIYVGGLLAVVGVVLVPTALAQRPDDQAGPRGPGAVAPTALPVESVRPDDRAEPRGPGTLYSASVRPNDRPTHGPGSTTVEPIVVVESTGFDWTYPALAGALAVVAALIVAAVLMTRHHGGPRRLAPHS